MARGAGIAAGSNAEWIKWGEVDPKWGVASWDGKEAGSSDAWTDEEFFELGRRDWEDFLARWRRYGLAEDGICVEIGTGVGRMALAMTDTFTHVHGVDVAPGMLAAAEKALAGKPVTLHLSDGLRIPLDDDAVDAGFSCHVFQHLDTMEDVDRNWAELARVVKPGGTILVHLPVHYWPAGMEGMQRIYDLRRSIGDFRANRRRRKMAGGGAPIMRGFFFEWNALESKLNQFGFTNVELNIFRMNSNGGQHSFVLARRA